jgi:hypothetical protein
MWASVSGRSKNRAPRTRRDQAALASSMRLIALAS